LRADRDLMAKIDAKQERMEANRNKNQEDLMKKLDADRESDHKELLARLEDDR
jgi:hypothetical protein